MSSAPQLLNAQQHQRPNESISHDSREEPLQGISKSSEADNAPHDDSHADKFDSPILGSAIPAEMVGKVIISKCKSPPHELCPYLNTNEILMRSKIVPEQKGPDFKTESPLSAKTIEMIRLHGRKEASASPVPGEADYHAKVPMPQADLAVSPFKTQPKLQTKKRESTSK